MPKKVVCVVILLVIAAFIATIFLTPALMAVNRTTYVATIVKISDGLVYVYDRDTETTKVFKDADNWYLPEREGLTYEELKPGYSYLFDVAGYRIPFIGAYEEIVYVDFI